MPSLCDREKNSEFHGQPVSDLDFHAVKGLFSSIKKWLFLRPFCLKCSLRFFRCLCEERIKPICQHIEKLEMVYFFN